MHPISHTQEHNKGANDWRRVYRILGDTFEPEFKCVGVLAELAEPFAQVVLGAFDVFGFVAVFACFEGGLELCEGEILGVDKLELGVVLC
jgi:hypothetical protein